MVVVDVVVYLLLHFIWDVLPDLYSRISAMILLFSLSAEKNFALMGMAGVMSGVMHAPLTGVFLIAELTEDTICSFR